MKTPLGTTFLICLYYWLKIPITTISTILGVGKKTVGFWGSVIRVCCSKLWNSTQRVVGGEENVVEIDEEIWRKRKYGRGRKKDQIWIFGGVERLEGGGAGSRFMTIVPNRKKITLIPIIQKYILPKTMIISDEWRAYSCLESIGYGHQTVCHKKEYVNKETHTCTNTIEGLWSHLRASFPRFGTRKKFISDHIAMYLVKSSMKLSFLELMKHVSKYKPEKEIEEMENEEEEEEDDDDDEIDEDVPFIEDILGNDENETDKKMEEDDSDGAGDGDSASEYSP